ncbi:MAG: hypothetical protein ACE15F_23300 [bacterium]
MTTAATLHAWWERLRHQGLLLSQVVLQERFKQNPSPVDRRETEKLRDAFQQFRALNQLDNPDPSRKNVEIDQNSILQWTDKLLESLLGYDSSAVLRQNAIPDSLKIVIHIGSRGETLKPHRVIVNGTGPAQPLLLLMADTSPQTGRGRGRTPYARFMELLRGTGHRLGLLTNGLQFRLIYAGLDFETWCEWDAARWFEDGEGAEELWPDSASCFLPPRWASKRRTRPASWRPSRIRAKSEPISPPCCGKTLKPPSKACCRRSPWRDKTTRICSPVSSISPGRSSVTRKSATPSCKRACG